MINTKFERSSSVIDIIKKEVGLLQKPYRNLNQTDVGYIESCNMKSIVNISSVFDLYEILTITNEPIALMGTCHTMGGHTMVENGIRINTKTFNKILEIDLKNKNVTVQPGITWSELIVYLNNFGMSPKTMQSYSEFSVGGSIFGANAHGILSDYNIGHSVVSFQIMLPNTKCFLVNAGEPLFNYIIGSYGVFGFVYELTLKIVPNDKLRMIDKTINVENGCDEFMKDMFNGTHTEDNSNDKTHVKFIRFNSKLNKMKYFQYIHTGNITSKLNRSPPSISYLSSIIFHWCVHWSIFKKIKGIAEKITKVHLDAVYKSENINLVDRNVFAYESPEYVSGKLSYLNATHVLQEYFIPNLNDLPYKFILLLKQKYKELKEIELLNVTLRIVKKDEYPFILSYSPKSHMLAYVLYIRLGLSEIAKKTLKEIQIELNDFVTKNGGTFYLPYLHHYTSEQILTAYPNMLEYIKLKREIDTNNRFTNKWFQNMEKILESDLENYKLKINFNDILNQSVEILEPEILKNKDNSDYIFNFDSNCENTIKNMMCDIDLQTKFKMFLQYVFTIYKHENVMNILEKYCELNDKKLYIEHLLPCYLNNLSLLNIFKFPSFIIRTRNTLNFQFEEIHKQIEKLLHFTKTNRFTVTSILNVGDKGRYHSLYTKIFPNILSRNYITVDWNDKKWMWFNNMQNEEFNSDHNKRKHDVIFALAGLHHYSLKDLENVLKHCQKTIKDKGLLILREHDVTSEKDNILVRNAHTIFNALVGEPYEIESTEMVLFRSKIGWEKLLEKYGFSRVVKVEDDNFNSQEVIISELQLHDPTRNFMMCFQYNDPNRNKKKEITSEISFETKTFEELGGKIKPDFNSFSQISEWFNVEYAFEYPKFLVDYPWYLFPFKKASDQMIETCKFAYNIDKKDGVKISSDIIMSLFVIICHCTGCLFLSFFGYLLNKFMDAKNVGGTREILVLNPNKYNLESTTIIFNNKEYKAKVLNVKNETSEYLVEIPMYRPFTEIVKAWFDSDENITITSISGNSKVWVDVRGNEIKSEKWAIHTKNSLNDENFKLNTIKLNVNELRELHIISKQNKSVMLQIFQQ